MIANVTQAGMKWPSPASAKPQHEERQISFEMSEEGFFPPPPTIKYIYLLIYIIPGTESVILFVWWKATNGEIHYERIAQQIQVSA